MRGVQSLKTKSLSQVSEPMIWQDYKKMEMLRAVFLKRGVTRIQSMGYWLNPSDKGYENNLLLN